MIKTNALILAGGLGTRVSHIFNDIPKPLFPVNNKPFLGWVFDWLINQNISRIIVTTSHLSKKIISYLLENYSKKVEIIFANEEDPLGTGGAIINSLKKISSERFLVFNADTLCLADLAAFINFHKINNFDVSIIATHIKNNNRYGSLKVENKKVINFIEKSTKNRGGYINAGIYCINKEIFKNLSPVRCSIEKDIFPLWIKQKKFGCFITSQPFIDMGTEKDYNNSARFIKNNLKAFKRKN